MIRRLGGVSCAASAVLRGGLAATAGPRGPWMQRPVLSRCCFASWSPRRSSPVYVVPHGRRCLHVERRRAASAARADAQTRVFTTAHVHRNGDQPHQDQLRSQLQQQSLETAAEADARAGTRDLSKGARARAEDGGRASVTASSPTGPPSPSPAAASESVPAPPPKKPSSPLARENIYTVPNILTASRLVMAPFVGYCIVHDMHAWSLALFAWAGVSDLLDGWIARRWNQGTVVGTVIDPMADKTLMLVLTASLAVKGALPLWLVAIIIGRDVGLAISAIYYRYISLPPPKTFMRYWDFSLPSAEVRPTTISKYNTFLQLALMGFTLAAPVIPLEMGAALTAMQYIVAATTVWSGASYIYSKDAVRILSQTKKVGKK